jgi:hypothetical protein
VGTGLLIADKLTDYERRAAGWALVAVGALTTVPIAMNVLGKSDRCGTLPPILTVSQPVQTLVLLR